MAGTDGASSPSRRSALTRARVRAAVASAHGERSRSAAVIDGLIVALMLLGAVWGIWSAEPIWQLLPSWWPVVDVGIGVLASVALWWRRRHPVLVAGALAVLGGFFVSAGAPAVVALYTVTALRRSSIAIVMTLVHLGIAIPYFLLVPVPGVTFGVWVVLMVLIYVTAFAVGLAVRARRQVIAGLVDAVDAERLEQQRRLTQARDSERADIAREMHDVLAHRLSILAVHAGALEHRLRPDGAPPEHGEIRDAAGVIRSSAHLALEELRDVLGVLGAGGELGTAAPTATTADLDRLVGDATASGQRVDLDVAGADRLRSARAQLQRTVYRVVQEGLTNARKHAPGAGVRVEVEGADAGVRILVRNALPVGVTPTELPGSRAGLTGLAERVRLDGGTLAAGAEEGAFLLQARLPWRT